MSPARAQMDYLLFLIGLGLLLWGADRLVDAATGLARRLGVSTITTAVVVAGFGTSMPELLTSLDAALQGSPALAVANVVGSNIANVLLVLGFSALCMPLACEPSSMRRDLPVLIVASLATLLALQQGVVGRWTGLALAVTLVAYLAHLVWTSPRDAVNAADDAGDPGPVPSVRAGTAWSAFAIAVLAGGAHLLVSGALGIAERHGISESTVGLTLVAIGTSLPELAVALVALFRRSAEVAIGNIIGSNLFNVLGILGITALVSPLAVPDVIARFDVWVMLAAAVALAVFVRTGWRVTRVEGAALLAAYPVYLGVLAA